MILRAFSNPNDSVIESITYQFDRQCQKLQYKKRKLYGENKRSCKKNSLKHYYYTGDESLEGSLLNQNCFLLMPMQRFKLNL